MTSVPCLRFFKKEFARCHLISLKNQFNIFIWIINKIVNYFICKLRHFLKRGGLKIDSRVANGSIFYDLVTCSLEERKVQAITE